MKDLEESWLEYYRRETASLEEAQTLLTSLQQFHEQDASERDANRLFGSHNIEVNDQISALKEIVEEFESGIFWSKRLEEELEEARRALENGARDYKGLYLDRLIPHIPQLEEFFALRKEHGELMLLPFWFYQNEQILAIHETLDRLRIAEVILDLERIAENFAPAAYTEDDEPDAPSLQLERAWRDLEALAERYPILAEYLDWINRQIADHLVCPELPPRLRSAVELDGLHREISRWYFFD